MTWAARAPVRSRACPPATPSLHKLASGATKVSGAREGKRWMLNAARHLRLARGGRKARLVADLPAEPGLSVSCAKSHNVVKLPLRVSGYPGYPPGTAMGVHA